MNFKTLHLNIKCPTKLPICAVRFFPTVIPNGKLTHPWLKIRRLQFSIYSNDPIRAENMGASTLIRPAPNVIKLFLSVIFSFMY
jgi:hypothetical protein